MKEAEKKLYNLLSKILEIPAKSINDKTAPENVESWDSFNGLMIATELERVFEATFTIDEVISVKNVGDIKKNLRNHKIDI
jgi:acyl carrier protein